MAIRWKDAFDVGNAEIDQQHQEIFNKANAFLDAVGIAALTEYSLGFFQYTRDHFSLEEGLMRSIDYPAIEVHIQQHKELVERLNEVAANIGGDDFSHRDLELFLTDWLLVHIRIYDTKLASYIARKQSGLPQSPQVQASQRQRQ